MLLLGRAQISIMLVARHGSQMVFSKGGIICQV
jgi:hypothetical protein